MFPEAYNIGTNYKLSRIKEFELDFDYAPMNALVMWEPPLPNTEYTVGVDPSWGVGQDRAAIHVMKNGTMHSKDMQVAEFSSNELNVHELTPICYMIGNLYKNTAEDREALMSVECNISDDVVHQLRNNFQYSNLFVWKFYDNLSRMWSNKLGWWTNSRTRPKIISKAIHYVKQGWWDISSPWLINEMLTVEKLEDKQRIEASAGHHDDLFMAAAIALWSAHDLEFNNLGVEELPKQRERRLTTRVEAREIEQEPLNVRRDFFNTACSYDEMMNHDFPESD